MNKKILIIISLLIFPVMVKASNNVTLISKCTKSSDTVVTCMISAKIKSGTIFNGFQATVEGIENDKSNTATVKNGGTASLINSSLLVDSMNLEESGTKEIVELKFENQSSSFSGKLTNIKISIDDGTGITASDLDLVVKSSSTDSDLNKDNSSNNNNNNSNNNNNNSNNTVKDSDASLKDLKVNGVSFSSSFSSGKYEYSAETNASEVTIEAAANSSKATVSGTGKKTLKDGDNKFEITVTAENGNRSKYTIIVTKTDKVTDTSVTTTEKSSTKNPKTGVYSITIIGIIVLAISTVIFINRKKLNLFKKI